VVDGIPLRVLGLRRILASKRAAGRKKDLAVIPALKEALVALEGARDRTWVDGGALAAAGVLRTSSGH
jgi:hypothetical protein